MARTRAKFRCNWVKDTGNGSKIVQLGVVYSRKDGEENHDFTKATPTGHIEMQIDNPAAAVQFKPLRDYYVEFEEAPEDKQQYDQSGAYKNVVTSENLNPSA